MPRGKKKFPRGGKIFPPPMPGGKIYPHAREKKNCPGEKKIYPPMPGGKNFPPLCPGEKKFPRASPS
jgi:hypothetical protein